MKKTSKKILAMVLALMMVLSMGATAFAAEEPEDITVTLSVVNEDPTGEAFEDVDVTLPDGSTIYTLLTEYNRSNGDTGDVLWTTTGSTYGDSWYLDSMSYGGADYATEPSEKAPANYNIAENAWYKGYGLLSVNKNDDGTTSYTYLYAGYAWTYDVEGNPNHQDVNTTTMNQFHLSAGDKVVLTYQLQITQWTQDKPYTNVYPYLPENPPTASH